MPTAMRRKKKVVLDDQWMTLPDAARVLGITRPTVQSYAMRGALTYQTVAGRTVISRESVEKLARDLGKKSA